MNLDWAIIIKLEDLRKMRKDIFEIFKREAVMTSLF